MVKIDPYNTRKYYDSWKNSGAIIEDISEHNAKLIRKFIFDLEDGTNVNTSNKKGSRSYIRLIAYKSKLKVIIAPLEKEFGLVKIEETTKEQLNKILKSLREGVIKRQDGKIYLDVGDYVKSFKAFWHWLQKISKDKLEDITLEADSSKEKPKWVYLDEKQYKKLAENCKPFYKLLAYFELDFGLRATECINTRVSDFQDDFKKLAVRDEVSKTYGRTVKSMLCRDLVKEYVEDNKLKEDDLLFNVSLAKINEYYKRRAKELFGNTKSKAGAKYSDLTLGDFRHCSACYWLPRYTTQQGMLYRFGWKKPDKIFYYSEFLGMSDNIQQEHMLVDVTKTDLQNEIEKLKKEMALKEESTSNILEENKKAIDELQQGFNDLLKQSKNDMERDIKKHPKEWKDGQVQGMKVKYKVSID